MRVFDVVDNVIVVVVVVVVVIVIVVIVVIVVAAWPVLLAPRRQSCRDDFFRD
jgi:hypothetical protein